MHRLATSAALVSHWAANTSYSFLGFGAVMEGRDIGTVVFPETPFKFFLTADPSERARRRIAQLRGAGKEFDPRAVEEEIADRDRRDSQREASPLTVDDSYIVVDSTNLSEEEVVEVILSTVRRE